MDPHEEDKGKLAREGPRAVIGGIAATTEPGPQQLKVPAALESQIKSLSSLSDAFAKLESRLTPAVVSPETTDENKPESPENPPTGVAETIVSHNELVRSIRSRINSVTERLEI